MLTMEESIVIHRPRKEVYEYAVAPDRQPEWLGNLIEYEAERDGPPEVGDRNRAVARMAGRSFTSTQEITEAVPGEKLAFRSDDGPFEYRFEWRFEDDGDGTRLTIHGEGPGFAGWFGRLSDPLVVKLFSRDMRSNLENLKALLEDV